MKLSDFRKPAARRRRRPGRRRRGPARPRRARRSHPNASAGDCNNCQGLTCPRCSPGAIAELT
ncbi:hypothetical protein GXW82_44400 [Streptacidiphilus sp. 4-A2]|nr:hypothetical protein [Streptacidiphilus sp. 4-A2]